MKTEIVRMDAVEVTREVKLEEKKEDMGIGRLLPIYDDLRRQAKLLKKKVDCVYDSIRAQIEATPGNRYEDEKWEAFLQESASKVLDKTYFEKGSFTRKHFLEMIESGALSVSLPKLVMWVQKTNMKDVPTTLPIEEKAGTPTLQVKPKGGYND